MVLELVFHPHVEVSMTFSKWPNYLNCQLLYVTFKNQLNARKYCILIKQLLKSFGDEMFIFIVFFCITINFNKKKSALC